MTNATDQHSDKEVIIVALQSKLLVGWGVFQSMNKRFFFHSFRALVGMVVFFLIPPPTVLKKKSLKNLSSSFSSKCRLIHKTAI